MTKHASNVEAWEEAIAAAIAVADRDEASRRARRDAARDIIASDIPDPQRYARYMPLALVEALLSTQEFHGGYHVRKEIAELLRPYGLVEYGGCFLTAFGIHVRRALIEEDA